jgi:hypothetical protein
MADEESLRQIAQSRAPFSAWLGILILFALFGVIVLAVIGPAPRGDSYEETRAKKRVDNLKTLRDEDAKALTSYSWVDKNKGTARIPISRAMEITVAGLAQKKPAPAGPIATPPPQAASPAPAKPGTQLGASATPAASPGGSAKPVASPSANAAPSPPGGTKPAGSPPAAPSGSPPVPASKPSASPSAKPAPAPPAAVTTS